MILRISPSCAFGGAVFKRAVAGAVPVDTRACGLLPSHLERRPPRDGREQMRRGARSGCAGLRASGRREGPQRCEERRVETKELLSERFSGELAVKCET